MAVIGNDPRLRSQFSICPPGSQVDNIPYTIKELRWARITAKNVSGSTKIARVVVPGFDDNYVVITLEQWANSSPLLEAIAAFDADGHEFDLNGEEH